MTDVPAYYTAASGLTVWDVVEAFALPHHAASAVEYVIRAGRKTPDPREDLTKALRCIEREIEVYERSQKAVGGT